jgi:hypothetical protein
MTGLFPLFQTAVKPQARTGLLARILNDTLTPGEETS